ncbi:hypothetical protein M0R01_03895 [bacterium]|nr:hypothetical protein [bacterium]
MLLPETKYEKSSDICEKHKISLIVVMDPIGCYLYNCYQFCPECSPSEPLPPGFTIERKEQ